MGRAGKIHLACLREAGGEEARVCWLVDTDAAVLAPYAQVPLSLSLTLTLTLTLTVTLTLTLTQALTLTAVLAPYAGGPGDHRCRGGAACRS